MRRLFTFALVASLPALTVGCCSGGSKTGWSFQVGKPASIESATVLGPQVTNYGGFGFASTPVIGSHALAAQVGDFAQAVALPVPRPSPSIASPQAASSCTLDEICRKLDRLIEAMGANPRSKPMPKDEE